MTVPPAPRQSFPGLISLLRNGAALFAGAGGEAVIRGVYAIAIGVWIGASDYGLWSYILTLYAAILVATSFGIETSLEARGGRGVQAAREFIDRSLGLRLLSLVFASLVIAAIGVTRAEESLGPLYLLAIPAVLGRGVATWNRSVLTAREAAVRALRVGLPIRLAELATGLALLLSGYGLPTLLVVHGLSWLAEAGWGLAAVRRELPDMRPRFDRLHRLLTGQDLSVWGTVVGLAILNAIPVLLAKEVDLPLSDLGNLAMALQVATFMVIGVQAFMSAAFPVLGRAAVRSDPKLVTYAWGSVVLVCMATALLFLGSRFFGESLLTVLLGPDFVLAGQLLPLAIVLAGLVLAPIGLWQVLVVRGTASAGAFAVALGVAAAAGAVLISGPRLDPAEVLLVACCGWGARLVVILVAFVREPAGGQNPT